ncbi:LysR substrate-binding domain-containing protein [Acinetobacter lactucae]|uniref:LysR substrate-binding domain-containing protein n=2 Tax=Acinetobacter lactucae TaxID=1785128 RepID=UPI001580F0CC|nr:LysR substrate-binding domain-containing protein [Acinetobacter lactucae]NUF38379.1 LysR family transcriptional regulator [Acinetobacter lactucae]
MNDYAKLPTNLDLDALRSFVKGIELGSFYLAAQNLCRSPAAISAQLKKLEQQTGCQLLRKNGRLLELTPSGELLFSHAKSVLAMNDRVLLQLHQTQATGIIRFGLQEDFAEGTLQQLIAQFMLQYPKVQFQIQVDRNFNLLEKVQKQELDLALIWQQDEARENFYELQNVETEWLFCSHPHIQQTLETGSSIPLVVLQQPCILRQMAIQALEEKDLEWHIAYECNSVQALWPAIRAGIGISLRSLFQIPSDIKILNSAELPQLKSLSFGLYSNSKLESGYIVQQFQKYIEHNLQ